MLALGVIAKTYIIRFEASSTDILPYKSYSQQNNFKDGEPPTQNHNTAKFGIANTITGHL
jgi:hypothetical protein